MFVIYDSTKRLFNQLMMAKNIQNNNNDYRSGYIQRPFYFFIHFLKSILDLLLMRKSTYDRFPLIYLRGDESSHFRERGNIYQRRNIYPA